MLQVFAVHDHSVERICSQVNLSSLRPVILEESLIYKYLLARSSGRGHKSQGIQSCTHIHVCVLSLPLTGKSPKNAPQCTYDQEQVTRLEPLIS